jgi:hypothetical protein
MMSSWELFTRHVCGGDSALALLSHRVVEPYGLCRRTQR